MTWRCSTLTSNSNSEHSVFFFYFFFYLKPWMFLFRKTLFPLSDTLFPICSFLLFFLCSNLLLQTVATLLADGSQQGIMPPHTYYWKLVMWNIWRNCQQNKLACLNRRLSSLTTHYIFLRNYLLGSWYVLLMFVNYYLFIHWIHE